MLISTFLWFTFSKRPRCQQFEKSHVTHHTIVKCLVVQCVGWLFNRTISLFFIIFFFVYLFLNVLFFCKRLNKFVEWCGLFCSRFANLIYEPCGFHSFGFVFLTKKNMQILNHVIHSTRMN